MAGIINRLTARGAAAISVPGRHADGQNLYLNISKAGSRSWVFLYKRDGRQREMGLGSAAPGAVSLAEAREAAAAARRILASGGDPLDARSASKKEARVEEARGTTFGEFADAFVDLHEAAWRNPKHRAQWRSTLGDSYCSQLRKKPISQVETEDVLDVIRPLWLDRRETANRIRQRIETVLDAAVVDGRRSPGLNPARWKGHLALLLPKQARGAKGHHAALPWAEMPDFVSALSEREGVAARALEFLIFTAGRSGEVRGARWSEIDLERGLWIVPADRMKAGREHRVPLSPSAVAAVQTMLPLRPRRAEDISGALVFPGLRRAPLSDMTLSAVIKRMNVASATPHGFRSSFRDWAASDGSASFEAAEMCLAHVVGNQTVQAYLRADLFEQRRELLDRWANFLTLQAPAAG
ncbi:tyrosine-type recombinase/integrase [Paracoccus aminophilus]|uniref:Phage integrase n=1 Tax=Paracoccus aminophilus JCM 7686 TaxID=1367847 RepID=S5Y198_PARAH|nr:site-specific integrase [Paracoccus aminophilus]AGT09475.1 phage integrase [Paracoccus aminophilus JCM 7686]